MTRNTTAIGLCLFAIAAITTTSSSIAMPSEAPTQSSHELEIFPLSQIFNGLRLVRDVAKKLLTDGRRPPAPVFELGQRAVCTMFNFYLQFTTTLFNTPPNTALYGNYSSNQLITWSVMQSACQWVQAKRESATLLNNCTVNDIAHMCLNFNLYQMVLGLLRDVDRYIANENFLIAESANDWINTNLNGDLEPVPDSAVDLILELYGCSMSSDGIYVCSSD